jgi:hypothetical protein
MDVRRSDWLTRSTLVDTDDCLEPPWRSNGMSPYTLIQVRGQRIGAHAFVCAQAHGPAPDGHQAAHSCGNPRCVNKRHVRWATPKENQADRIDHGTTGRGEANPAAKLTADEVLLIRAAVEAGESKSSAARQYQVSVRLVRFIVQRKKWAHL